MLITAFTITVGTVLRGDGHKGPGSGVRVAEVREIRDGDVHLYDRTEKRSFTIPLDLLGAAYCGWREEKAGET